MLAHLQSVTDDSARAVIELISRFHSGRWPTFRRMIAIKRVGAQLVEVAQWRHGGFAVVFWSLAGDRLSWRSATTTKAARSIFDGFGSGGSGVSA